MDNQYYKNEAVQIISELYDEFSKEGAKNKVKADNNCARLEELDHQIRSLSKTEDIEMKVFSPRRQISAETERVTTLKKEREELDRVNRETERDYRYYSKRAEKLGYLLDLLERNEGIFIDSGPFDSAKDPSIAAINPKILAEQKETLSADLEKIQHRLDTVYHFIDSDVPRAKMEIKNLMLQMEDLIVKND